MVSKVIPFCIFSGHPVKQKCFKILSLHWTELWRPVFPIISFFGPSVMFTVNSKKWQFVKQIWNASSSLLTIWGSAGKSAMCCGARMVKKIFVWFQLFHVLWLLPNFFSTLPLLCSSIPRLSPPSISYRSLQNTEWLNLHLGTCFPCTVCDGPATRHWTGKHRLIRWAW